MVKNVLTALVTLLLVLALLELSLFLVGLGFKSRIDVVDGDLESDTVRIVCIGESTTFGLRVDKSQAYPAVIERKLPEVLGREVKVYNLGIYAQTSTTILRTFERNLLLFRPQLVIVNMGHNDFSRSLNRQNTVRDPKLPMTLTKLLYQLRVYRAYKLLMDSRNEANRETHKAGQKVLLARYNRAAEKRALKTKAFKDAAKAQLEFNTQRMIAIAQRHEVDLVFVGYLDSGATPIMQRIVENEGAPWVDVRTSRALDLYVSRDKWHPSPTGHEHIADRILQHIVRDELID